MEGVDKQAALEHEFRERLSTLKTSFVEAIKSQDPEQLNTAIQDFFNAWIETICSDEATMTHVDQTILETFFLELETLLTDNDKFLDFLDLLNKTSTDQIIKKSFSGACEGEDEEGDVDESGVDESIYATDGYFTFFFVFSRVQQRIIFRDIDAIREEAEALDLSGPLEVIYPQAIAIEEKLKKLFDDKEFTYREEDVSGRTGSKGVDHRFTSKDAEDKYLSDHLTLEARGCCFGVMNLFEKIRAIKGMHEIRSVLGTVDKETLNQNRLKYGAKGANLILLKNLIPKLQGTSFENCLKMTNIPEFELVPADIYLKWASGENTEIELRKVYEDVQNWDCPLAVRSSAVYSEDGENITGAGIYDTKFTKSNGAPTFEEFRDAVYAVYESCNSTRAQKYRTENGIEQEAMGLVIQKEIKNYEKGYVNSTRPYSQNLLEIVLENHSEKTSYLFNKAKVRKSAMALKVRPPIYSENLHVQLDLTWKDQNILPSVYYKLAGLIMILEQHYGHPVQVEFVIEEDDDDGNNVRIVQGRPLPKKMFSVPQVDFPKETPYIAEFDSIGTCDETLEVLDPDYDLSDKKGISLIRNSEGATIHSDFRTTSLPKEGVVIMLTRSRAGFGHMETLALEKGLVVLSANSDWRAVEALQAAIKIEVATISNTKFRVVSNGEKARIYAVAQ